MLDLTHSWQAHRLGGGGVIIKIEKRGAAGTHASLGVLALKLFPLVVHDSSAALSWLCIQVLYNPKTRCLQPLVLLRRPCLGAGWGWHTIPAATHKTIGGAYGGRPFFRSHGPGASVGPPARGARPRCWPRPGPPGEK